MNARDRIQVVALAVASLAYASCSREPPMTSTPSAAVSAFTPMQGGFSDAIAPGGSRLVTLARGAGATWWDHDKEITANLPPGTPVSGSRWLDDGNTLRVGLGTLDLVTRAWKPEPLLAAYTALGPRGQQPVREVAWTPDARHVAILLESRGPSGTRSTEVAIVALDSGNTRAKVAVEGASSIATSNDRILVAGTDKLTLLDLDGKVITQPSPVPDSVTRVRESSDTFAAIGAAGDVALVRPSDGAVLATWIGANAVDAVPITKGVVAVTLEGVVRVGCLDGNNVKPRSETRSGVMSAVVQIVGERLVVAGAGANPVHVATFTNGCK